jgi:transposase
MLNDDHLDLWSLDECHFQQHGTRCRMWVPPETKDPIVFHAPTRKSLALFGAVNFHTGQLVTMFCPVFDAQTFEAFLHLLRRHRRRRVCTVVVLDNATYHHAAAPGLAGPTCHASFRLDFLPPYSPELNPIERVWKFLRRRATHNQYFATLDLLVVAVAQEIRPFQHPNQTLRTLCCKN